VRSRKHLCLLLEINKSVPTCVGGESLTSSAIEPIAEIGPESTGHGKKE
jgi:hypothetical protein